MARSNNKAGQRTNLSNTSGPKKRSPSSTSHRGSRVDPSHVTEHAREVREKKAAAAKKVAKKAKKSGR